MSVAAIFGFGLGGCEGYPGGFGIFSGFADDMKVKDGYLRAHNHPGLGWEGMAQLYPKLREMVADVA